MTEQHPDALISYTCLDNQRNGAALTTFREKLSDEVSGYIGQSFHIFQDIEDIKWGQQFEQRIDQALATITFFLPILTPSFFNSTFCRYELEKFLQREAHLGRNDLVLPVYYIRVPALENPALRANDPLAQTIAARQRIDWRNLRIESFEAPQVRLTLMQMAEQIADVWLQSVSLEPPPPPPPTITTPAPKPAPRNLQPATLPPWVPELVEIPAGPFLMGSSNNDELAYDGEKPQHRLELPTYWIGKTPVINAQFRPFVEGDGYRNQDYWTKAGWQWRTQNKIVKPDYWDNAKWNGDEQPVVGVSWFEAVAYCRWLSAQTGQDFRLPTEAEWEKAARGPDGLLWPWGNTWEAGRCNSEEAGLDKTTPVRQYPSGASPYGALDMAGNVWEWCATKWQKTYPYQQEEEWRRIYLEDDSLRVIRGGSWYNSQKFARGAYRFVNYDPRYRYNGYGLRLVSHSPPGSDE